MKKNRWWRRRIVSQRDQFDGRFACAHLIHFSYLFRFSFLGPIELSIDLKWSPSVTSNKHVTLDDVTEAKSFFLSSQVILDFTRIVVKLDDASRRTAQLGEYAQVQRMWIDKKRIWIHLYTFIPVTCVDHISGTFIYYSYQACKHFNQKRRKKGMKTNQRRRDESHLTRLSWEKSFTDFNQLQPKCQMMEIIEK